MGRKKGKRRAKEEPLGTNKPDLITIQAGGADTLPGDRGRQQDPLRVVPFLLLPPAPLNNLNGFLESRYKKRGV